MAAGFDVIDINFGCPVKKVLGRCRGGYLLGQVDTALEIVARVREAVPAEIPVTVKMRRGLDDTPASRDNFYRIFDGAFQRGVAAITVHGRTVVQRYVGPSRWEFLRELKQHAGSRTVLGSGDLFTPQACLDMIAQTGVDGVTAARGAIGNPWIFAQARALAAGLPLPEPPSVHRAARRDRRALSPGRGALWSRGLRPAHAQIRHQVFSVASPAPAKSATPSSPSAIRANGAKCSSVGTAKICPAGIRWSKSTSKSSVPESPGIAPLRQTAFLFLDPCE